MSLLLIQFLLILFLFPGTLLLLAVATWRRRSLRRQQASILWILTLVLWSVWATRLMTSYVGRDFDVVLRYFWRVGTNYALPLAMVSLLAATYLYLDRTIVRRPLGAFLVGPVLIGGAIALDPALWAYAIPSIQIADFAVDQFSLWAIAWSASVLLPLLFAWLMTEQGLRTVPQSLYRNQVSYWFAALCFALVGAILALFQSEYFLQQIGSVLFTAAAFMGLMAITQTQLVNLQGVLNKFGQELSRIVLITLLLFVGLVVLFQLISPGAASFVVLLVASVALALLLSLVTAIYDRVRLRLKDDTDINLEYVRQQLQVGGSLLAPDELTHLFQQMIRTRLQTQDVWLLNVQEMPAGGVLLTPQGREIPHFEPTLFTGENPFVLYLYRNTSPLVQRDIDDLHSFNDMSIEERRVLASWGRTLHVPIRSNSRLVALLSLASKETNEAYDRRDFAFLEDFATQMGSMLSQARQVQALRRVSHDVFERNLSLAQEGRRLHELVALYEQFTALLSPELRKPFTQLEIELRQIEAQIESTGGDGRTSELSSRGSVPAVSSSSLGTMRHQVDESQAMVDNLIAIASHLEKQSKFDFSIVYVDTIIRDVMSLLEPMAEARRVELELDIRGKLVPVWGDGARLHEAIQQLMHNAVKYNRVNGSVQVVCQMVRNEVRVQVIDYGVGIPPNRLDDLWQGLTKLLGTDGKSGRRRTRIGLPLVKFIVQSHGGHVDLRSTYGSGSTFSIYLPALLDELHEADWEATKDSTI